MQTNDIAALVVDDSQHMRAIMREMLRAVGLVSIKEAADAVEAFQILKTFTIDVVLTDLAMPLIDGIEFVHLIRTSPDSPSPFVPVIMVTGHSDRASVVKARDAGVNEFLVKPVTAQSLLDRLNAVVASKRAYVRAGNYVGPDRRRRETPGYKGPFRRVGDRK
jgi:two-component system, chemotaxis family, chemotaxis protein CheY